MRLGNSREGRLRAQGRAAVAVEQAQLSREPGLLEQKKERERERERKEVGFRCEQARR